MNSQSEISTHSLGNGEPDPVAFLQRQVANGTPYAIVQKQGVGVHLFSGPVEEYERLEQIPREKNPPLPFMDIRYNALGMIPYNQLTERGREAQSNGAKIRCMHIQEQTRITLQDLLSALPDEPVELSEQISFSQSEEQYVEAVRSVIREQIEEGNLCNVVLSLKAEGAIAEMSPHTVLSMFRRLLQSEFGSYMTYFFFDGEQYILGASPERHVSVEHGNVTMNPISGTYRKTDGFIDKESFETFLSDPKEVNELFMCLDEELKQMAQMCEAGGRIEGPFLKEMSKVVHTEYFLVGHSEKDCFDLLRTSLHAPTVTGSPQQPACRVIAQMETEPRDYYAGEFFLTGHCDNCGVELLDSAIAIRSMTVLANGCVVVRAGASLVRDSVPEQEYRECQAKASGVLQAVTHSTTAAPQPQLSVIMDEHLQQVFTDRNRTLNQFLMCNQEGQDHTIPELSGKSATIINYEDDFSYMLRHMIEAAGAQANVVSYKDFNEAADDADIVIVGPGPGNPLNKEDEKMQILAQTTAALRENGRTFLSVCLGHQDVCRQLGFKIIKKEEPSQGVQKEIDFFGERENVAFYNTFAALNKKGVDGVDASFDESTGEIYALRGEHFSSFQFHPESILSQNGFKILTEELVRMMRNTQDGKQ